MKNFREYIKGNDLVDTSNKKQLEDLTINTMPDPAINQSEELTPKEIDAKRKGSAVNQKYKADKLKRKLDQYRNAPGGINTPNYRATDRELRKMQYGK